MKLFKILAVATALLFATPTLAQEFKQVCVPFAKWLGSNQAAAQAQGWTLIVHDEERNVEVVDQAFNILGRLEPDKRAAEVIYILQAARVNGQTFAIVAVTDSADCMSGFKSIRWQLGARALDRARKEVYGDPS